MVQTLSSDGKNPLREPKVKPLGDFVVAIDKATGEPIRAWPGSAYKPYNAAKVEQYRVSRVASTQAAIDQAMRVHRVTHSLEFSNVVKTEVL